MRMDHVVRHRASHSHDLKSAPQVIHLGPGPENIYDIDGVAKPSQLLYLVAHEGAGARSVWTWIHVRDTEDPHDGSSFNVSQVLLARLQICAANLFKPSSELRRHAHHERIVGHVLRYHRAGTDNRANSNSDAWQ